MPPPDEFDRLAAEAELDEFDRLAAEAEPPRLQLDQRNSLALPQQMDVALKARDAAPVDWLTQTAQEIQRRDAGRGSPEALRLLQKLENKEPIFKAAYKAPEVVKAAAEYSSEPGIAERVKNQFVNARKTEYRTAKTAMEKGMSAVDATRRLGTNAAISAVDPNVDFSPIASIMNDAPVSETSALALKGALEKSAKEGDMLGTGLNTVADAVSTVAGGVGTVLGGTAGRVWRKLDNNPNLPADDHDRVFKETLNESRDTTKEAALTILADPLTYTGFGGGAKGTRGISKAQGLRIGKGMTPGAAETFANALADLAQTKGGQADLAPAVESLARQFGIAPEQMSRVLGPEGRYLGKGGMTVGLPLISEKLTAELPKIPGLPEQLGARAIDAVSEKTGAGRALNRGVYGTDLGGVNPNAGIEVGERSRKARALALSDTADDVKRFQKDVAEYAPATKARREEIVRYFIDPDHRPGSKQLFDKDLTPQELDWANRIQAFFDDFRTKQVAAGTLDANQIGKNTLTGRYVPRMYEKADLVHGFENRPKTLASSQAQRGPDGGRPLGRDFKDPISGKTIPKPELDPNNILPQWAMKQNRKIQKAYFDRFAADTFGKPYNDPSVAHLLTGEDLPMRNSKGEDVFVPRDVALTLRQNYDQAYRAFQPENRITKWAMTRFKKAATIHAIPYFMANVPSDMTIMFAKGFRDPLRIDQVAKLSKLDPNKIAVFAPGKNWTVAEVRGFLKNAGIDAEGLSSSNVMADVDPMKGFDKMADQLTAATEAAARARGDKDAPRGFVRSLKWFNRHKGDLADNALSLGWARFGERLAREWDSTAKGAFFMDRLAKGDAPNIALQRTFEALPDFGNRTKLQDKLNRTMAFPGWISRMATEIPKTVAKNPSIIPLTKAVVKGAGEEGEDVPPKWVREKGLNFQADPYQTMAINEGLELAGQPPVDPVNRIGMRLRSPITDVAAPFAALADGDPQPLVAMSNPLIQAVAEQALGVDPLTRKPLKPATLNGMFPQGTPGVPPELYTKTAPNDPEQQIPWASRWLPSLLGVTPQAQMLANSLLGGPYLGRHRVEAPQEGQRTAASLFGMLTGVPMFFTDPVSGEQMTQDPNVQAAQDYESNLKKALEQQALKR